MKKQRCYVIFTAINGSNTMTHEEFMKIVREKNEWRKHPEQWTEAEKLRERILSGEKTNDEWLQLQKDVIDFFESKATEEEKQMLSGYTESMSMICAVIAQG
jgi:hypothetical protein